MQLFSDATFQHKYPEEKRLSSGGQYTCHSYSKSHIKEIISHETEFTPSTPGHDRLSHALSHALLYYDNVLDAHDAWKDVIKQYKATLLKNHERKELSLNSHSFKRLFDHVQRYKDSAPAIIYKNIMERITGNYGHQWNDWYEQRQKEHPRRSLAALRKRGVALSIPQEKLPHIRKQYHFKEGCPYLEQTKNDRILTINNFRNSKVSLAVHDCFDHFWTYDLLEKTGILAQHNTFLQSIGNPHTTDIFCREGELIASAGFHFRNKFLHDEQMTPLISYNEVYNTLKNNSDTTQCIHAAHVMEEQYHDPTFVSFFERSFSGIMVELMEQRRKHGFIRILDISYAIKETMPALHPAYCALLVDTCNTLYTQQQHAKNALYAIGSHVESFLQNSVTSNTESAKTVVSLDTIENPAVTYTWFTNKLGTLTSKERFC